MRDISLFNNNRRAVCEVEGNSGDYIVEIEVDQKTGRLHFDCDCPYAGNHFCKHMIAAAMELSDYLRGHAEEEDDDVSLQNLQPGGNWQNIFKRNAVVNPRAGRRSALTTAMSRWYY
ncbi:hypothetical protein [Candidatus Villigracilis saccharophilus]|uniref:SWIM zinc finger family protein n=1 Tax=Candidatus Villigracilis saccharophilus TaxID=3140684 RepID=UPI00313678BF|nr:hypothetical protein [Anaerolineales bacterium]